MALLETGQQQAQQKVGTLRHILYTLLTKEMTQRITSDSRINSCTPLSKPQLRSSVPRSVPGGKEIRS